MQEVRRCPVCGSIDVNLTYVEKRPNGKRYCKCAGCGYEDDINKFDYIGNEEEPEQLSWEPVFFEEDFKNYNFPATMFIPEDAIIIRKPKKKIDRPHYKELYEEEKDKRKKLQFVNAYLMNVNEKLSKEDQTEKINILLGCIDTISRYTSDWYIKNEIKRAREKISKIK